MTPAINLLKKHKVAFTVHSYEHDPDAPSYGLEAAEALGLEPARVFKTLLVSAGSNSVPSVAIVPVDSQLNLKAAAAALKTKKLEMADPTQAQRVTGYLVGGISPLGQKKQLTTVLDTSAEDWDSIYVSAGRRGLEIELAPQELARLCRATFHPLAKRD